MAQSPTVSRSTVAARVGPRRRKTEKEARYHEFRSFRSFREFSDWWAMDEGRNWKINSRQSHPRGSFQIDGCYVCPARLRIIIGFDDSVVLYRGGAFSHQHERKNIKIVDYINQAIPMDPFAEKIGRSFFVDAPRIEPENLQEFEMHIILMNIDELLVPVRELTGTEEGNSLNTPKMVVRTPQKNRSDDFDDADLEDVDEVDSDEFLPSNLVRVQARRLAPIPSIASSASSSSQSSVETTQVRPTQTQQVQQQPPKQTTEGVKEGAKEVQKPKEEQKSKEEVKEVIQKVKEVKKPATTSSSDVKTTKEDTSKTTKTKLTPPKFSGVTSGSAVARPQSTPSKKERPVNDDPGTQSDEDIPKKTARLVSPTLPKFVTEKGVTSGFATARPTTPPISEEERTNNEGSDNASSDNNSTNSSASGGSNNT
uniref:Uncharacterized protein n=1 Tax=Meloidogyne hapla TaxID=6305 RepID=A0A1I8B550_MELHA